MTADLAPTAGPDRLLTLALPAALEGELLDMLAQDPDRPTGFTLWSGHGLGDATLGTAMEQVQGRARRVVVQLALTEAQLAPLLARLHTALPSREVAWWVTPLLGFGRLA